MWHFRQGLRPVVAAGILFSSAAICRGAETPVRIEAPKDVDGRVIVHHLPARAVRTTVPGTIQPVQELLNVYTVVEGKRAPTAMLGESIWADGKLVFEPRFPFRRGVTYRAIVNLANAAAGEPTEVVRDFSFAEPTGPPTQLTAIYPTAAIVPENLLKIYLHFSAPMSRGEAYQRVRLRDEHGKLVEAPFLELSEELWSPDGMRLTLLFEPGRIKRGLQPRALFGPVLIEGGRYSLEIDPGWPDAQGRPLAATDRLKKSFRAEAPDDVQPAMQRWIILAPQAASRAPLVVQFDEPLDSAMLLRVLTVRDRDGKPIRGEIELGREEITWSFRPSQPWRPGRYTIVADTTLEDLAGNSLGRPFEVDVFRPIPNQPAAEHEELPFTVAP